MKREKGHGGKISESPPKGKRVASKSQIEREGEREKGKEKRLTALRRVDERRLD
jgi:hypothetical protein